MYNQSMNREPNLSQRHTKNNNGVDGYALSKGKQKRQSMRSSYKEIEELFEENMMLKKENNRLSEELSQVRGKL
jgi:hypothetical protein